MKDSFLTDHEVTVINKTVEDIMWVKVKPVDSHESLYLCVVYLPPDGSSRINDADKFYRDLMTQVYEYQNMGSILLCGDVNSRIGDEADYIEGVDSVPLRTCLYHVTKKHGEYLLDFLIDSNFCVLNGRLGKNDYTHISHRGKSVVDYFLVPHEQLPLYNDFVVHTITDVIENFNLHGASKTSDHSILTCELNPFPQRHADSTTPSVDSQSQKRYHVKNMPTSFLNCEESFVKINESIQKIERLLELESDVSGAFKTFVDLLNSEMESKLKPK